MTRMTREPDTPIESVEFHDDHMDVSIKGVRHRVSFNDWPQLKGRSIQELDDVHLSWCGMIFDTVDMVISIDEIIAGRADPWNGKGYVPDDVIDRRSRSHEGDRAEKSEKPVQVGGFPR